EPCSHSFVQGQGKESPPGRTRTGGDGARARPTQRAGSGPRISSGRCAPTEGATGRRGAPPGRGGGASRPPGRAGPGAPPRRACRPGPRPAGRKRLYRLCVKKGPRGPEKKNVSEKSWGTPVVRPRRPFAKRIVSPQAAGK